VKIIKEFDIKKFGKSKPKFDKNELSNLNSKFFQLIDYDHHPKIVAPMNV
jgi:thymidylate synthase